MAVVMSKLPESAAIIMPPGSASLRKAETALKLHAS